MKLLLILLLLCSGCAYTNMHLIDQSELSKPGDATLLCRQRIQNRGERAIAAHIDFDVRIYYGTNYGDFHTVIVKNGWTYPKFSDKRGYELVWNKHISTLEELNAVPWKAAFKDGMFWFSGKGENNL